MINPHCSHLVAISQVTRDGILGHKFNKDSFASMLFIVPSTGGKLFSGFQNPYTKIRETRKPESKHELHFVVRKNEDRNPTKTRVWEDFSLDQETLTKNPVQEFHLRTLICHSNAATWPAPTDSYLRLFWRPSGGHLRVHWRPSGNHPRA